MLLNSIPAILATTLLPTLAEATETNFLTYTIGTKQLSLSKQDDNIIYEFGPPRKPELVLKEPVATVDFQPWNGLGSTDADAVTFYNQNYSYTVITTSPYKNLVPSRSVWVDGVRRVRSYTRCCSRDVRRVWHGDRIYRSARRA